MNWYLDVLKKYVEFSGRARRTEFWMFALFNFIIICIIGFLETLLGLTGIFSSLYSLAVFLPYLGVTVRRLHDTGRSGWWALILLIPLIGVIVMLVFMILDSEPGDNIYGPNPKAAVA